MAREKGEGDLVGTVQSIGALTGVGLDQAFEECIAWLDEVTSHPCGSSGEYTLPARDGHIHRTDLGQFEISVKLTKDAGLESYTIDDRGLAEFTRVSPLANVDSSILGPLFYQKGHPDLSGTLTARFGTNWLKERSETNPCAKSAIEHMKRSAIRLVRACQPPTPAKTQ